MTRRQRHDLLAQFRHAHTTTPHPPLWEEDPFPGAYAEDLRRRLSRLTRPRRSWTQHVRRASQAVARWTQTMWARWNVAYWTRY